MNWSRLKSSRTYYEVHDSYRIPRLLKRARDNYEPYGLPLSVSVRQIRSRAKAGSEFLNNGGSSYSWRRTRLLLSSVPRRASRIHWNLKAWKFPSRVKGFLPHAAVKPRSRSSLYRTGPFGSNGSSNPPEKVFGASMEEEEEEDLPWESDVNFALPTFKCYKIQESCDEKQFHVVEIDIPEEGKEKLESAILNRTSIRFQRSSKQFLSRYLKAVVFSEKGASILWLFEARMRIILMSSTYVRLAKIKVKRNSIHVFAISPCFIDDEPNTLQWYSKIKNDVFLIKSKVNDEKNKWHPIVQWRLNQAIENCRELIQRINQSEPTVPNPIPDCQPANEAILRAARFVWHSLSATKSSTSSLNPPTQRLPSSLVSPSSSSDITSLDFKSSDPQQQLSPKIHMFLDGYNRNNGTTADKSPKSNRLKLLDELNKKLASIVPSKIRKMSQVVPWSIKGTHEGDSEEIQHGSSASSFNPIFTSRNVLHDVQVVA